MKVKDQVDIQNIPLIFSRASEEGEKVQARRQRNLQWEREVQIPGESESNSLF